MVESIGVTHITTAAVSVAFIQWLKRSSWFPWFTAEKAKLARVIAFVTAGIGTIGIAWAWDPATRSISFHIPTLAVMFGMAIAYAKSFIMQELTYQATKPTNTVELVKAVVAALNLKGSQPAAPVAAPEKV